MVAFFVYCLYLAILVCYVLSAEVTFDVALNSPDLDLDCKYTLDKNEKLTKMSIKKDGKTFLTFDGKTPEFLAIKEIDKVVLHGKGKVTINNYKDSTFGTYHCLVFYKKNKKEEFASKKLDLTFKKNVGCKAEWKKATFSTIPADSPSVEVDGVKFKWCRLTFNNLGYDVITPGTVVDDQGCVVAYLGKLFTSKEFEVLTGSGFEWVQQMRDEDRTKLAPPNSHQAGRDNDPAYTRPLYIGRCIAGGKIRHGKIDYESRMSYWLGDGDKNDCDEPHEIVLCKGG